MIKGRYIVLVLCLFVAALQEYYSLKLSSVSYYKGIVVDKHAGTGRDSNFYISVRWESVGAQPINRVSTIPVDPYTQRNIKVGDKYSTELVYIPFFGAAGTAKVPFTDWYLFIGALGFLAKIGLLIFLYNGIKHNFVKIEW